MVMEVKDVIFSHELGRIAIICGEEEVVATVLNNEVLPETGDKVNVCESTNTKYYGFNAVASRL